MQIPQMKNDATALSANVLYIFFGFINNFIALLNKIQQNVAYCKFKHDLHPDDAKSYRKNLSVRWMKTFLVDQKQDTVYS